MGQATQFTCDGCELVVVVERATSPPDWKEVRLEWSGLDGYPTSIRPGARTSDLCPQCALRLVEQMTPSRWPRPTQEQPNDP